MRGSSVSGEKHIQGNLLELHVRMFATELRDVGRWTIETGLYVQNRSARR